MNILGLIFIFSCLISVVSIFYGDFLIKYFNLEEKFPKIAKFIQLKKKISKFLS